jgi:hypothetical protein
MIRSQRAFFPGFCFAEYDSKQQTGSERENGVAVQSSWGTNPFFRLTFSFLIVLTAGSVLGVGVAAVPLVAQTSVLTWHYDNQRTGANTTETVLTLANVSYKTFGKLSTKPVDGNVVGQPLYVPGVKLADQSVHNIVYVATMHDSVYAFDADDTDPTHAPLWWTSIFTYSPAGATTMPATLKKDAGTTAWTELGIVSTPVIDLVGGTLYLVAETYENSQVVHRLHALDISSGIEKLGGPTTISASYTLNGVTTIFKDFYQMNRPGLLLANGQIFIAWGSNGNNNTSQGWVMAYDANTLQPTGAVTVEPGKTLASIWQKGAGIAADSVGNVYAVTAEGPYLAPSNLPESVVKLNAVNGLQLTDFFSPYNYSVLGKNDMDLTGVLLLPPQPGPYPEEMIAIGKEGTIYVVNRDQMGTICQTCLGSDAQIVQEIPQGAGLEGGNPSYWYNRVYFTGIHTAVQAYTLQNGTLVVPSAKTTQQMAGGGHSFITSNGTTNGILWLMNGVNLYGLDALTLKIRYSNTQAPNHRDQLPPLPHFPEPIAADGKIFIGTKNSLVTYGLLPQP